MRASRLGHHADDPGLLQIVERVRPRRIYANRGHADVVAHLLREEGHRAAGDTGETLALLMDARLAAAPRQAGRPDRRPAARDRAARRIDAAPRGCVAVLRLAQLRRIMVRAQGYRGRLRRADADDVRAAIARLSCVQLDSISAVERSHRLVLASRAGAYDERHVSGLLQRGRAFEYWAHEASILPIEDYPLFKRRMAERRTHHWFGPVIDRDPALARAVLQRIEKDGPLKSSDFEGRNVGMWGWKPARRMLDALWTAGELAVAGRESFQRLYDLPERVVPARQLATPAPTEAEWLRGLALRAVRARGALTARGILEHYRLKGGTRSIAPHLDALVREGELTRVEVEDEGEDVLVLPDTDLDPPAPAAAALLSPFDNLLWDRGFARRALGFDHLIEVYKPAPQRAFGYYVMPLLAGDRIVGRADVKADRAKGALRVLAFHREKGVKKADADEGLAMAHERLGKLLELEPARAPRSVRGIGGT